MNASSKLTRGQIVGFAAALLVLLSFFFPWIEFNLFLISTNLSGFQLATGSGPVGSNFPGVPSLLLVPLCMLGALAVVAACYLNSASQLKSAVSLILTGAGALCALIILYQYFNLNHELNQNVFGMITQRMFSYSFGAHASLLGSIAVAGGGLLDLATTGKVNVHEK